MRLGEVGGQRKALPLVAGQRDDCVGVGQGHARHQDTSGAHHDHHAQQEDDTCHTCRSTALLDRLFKMDFPAIAQATVV